MLKSDALTDQKISGSFGIHRFLGLYVVSSTQEEQNFWGPFAKRKEANAIFSRVVVLYEPPT
jgi:hypothetical protein